MSENVECWMKRRKRKERENEEEEEEEDEEEVTMADWRKQYIQVYLSS